LHRYPDGASTSLRQVIAEEFGVDPAAVLVGNGSEELLRLLVAAYAATGGTVALASPPCMVHERACRLAGAEVVTRPLSEWRHDLPALAECPGDIALICNPHNPTGTTVTRADLATFLDDRRAGLVVVDEAYIDFADDPDETSCIPLAAGRPDLVVVRTLSKIHGLAAARVGYLVADPDVVAALRKLQAPFSVNSPAQAAAAAALRDHQHREHARAYTRELREQLTDVFWGAGYDVVPSQANFVFVLTPDEDGLVSRLAAGGVRVRPGRKLAYPGSVRVTVPSEEGLRLVAAALAQPVR
jgi:histidinol-phosphate aminotransferase